ncbi:MAG: acyl-CoA desaturase [bacterium]|nr:acyl-CoA desaturase [bacterium]
MQETYIRFNTKDKPEFYKTLNQRVNQYFAQRGITKYGNTQMVIKSIFMFAVYFTPFVLMLTGVVSGTLPILAMWFVMGLGVAGIGLSVMHDANHGTYSKNAFLNKFMSTSLTFLGGYHMNWRIQHNVLHHTFTNIDGLDEDIEKKGIIRFSPNQEGKAIFKFQVLYAPVLYSILTLYWVTYKDFDQLIGYHKRDLLKSQKLTFKKALFLIILIKVLYYSVIIGLPIMLGMPWWLVVSGFLIMHAVGGLILALVFQSAHVLDSTDFVEPKESSVENCWAIHQMRTTSNFSVGNVPLTWFLGGLNHQVEHHLFPNICHVHYPALSKIVKETAKEYDIPYLQQKTFIGAISNHFKFLHHLGTKAA